MLRNVSIIANCYRTKCYNRLSFRFDTVYFKLILLHCHGTLISYKNGNDEQTRHHAKLYVIQGCLPDCKYVKIALIFQDNFFP